MLGSRIQRLQIAEEATFQWHKEFSQVWIDRSSPQCDKLVVFKTFLVTKCSLKAFEKMVDDVCTNQSKSKFSNI